MHPHLLFPVIDPVLTSSASIGYLVKSRMIYFKESAPLEAPDIVNVTKLPVFVYTAKMRV